jgi:Flp pilus assembly protein CpaB
MLRPFLILRRGRRAVLARRRPLAAVCAAVAVLATLRANDPPPPPPRTTVLTAAHDLPSGVVLRGVDVTLTPFDRRSVPAGVVGPRMAVGRTTAAPLRRGAPVTDVDLVAPSLLNGYPGLVGVPVRVGDAGAARLLRVGDRIDLLAADPRGETGAEVVGRNLPVLAIPRTPPEAPGLTAGALVVLGVPDGDARAVAQASVSAVLSVVLTR